MSTPATCRRQAPWQDQVVIVNTTTGTTLTTADVAYDPSQYGPLNPNASVAQQFAFTLPLDATGTGNIQVSVTTNLNHTAFEQGASLVTANLQTYTAGTDFPAGPTMLTVGGVDFTLVPFSGTANGLGVLQTAGSGSSIDIPVNITGASTVYTLINSTFGLDNDTVGSGRIQGNERSRRHV